MKNNPAKSDKKIIYTIAPYTIIVLLFFVFLFLIVPFWILFTGTIGKMEVFMQILSVGLVFYFTSYAPFRINVLKNQKLEFRYMFYRKILDLSLIQSVTRESAFITITHSSGTIRMPNDGWGTHKLAKSLQKENPRIELKGFAE